MGRLQPIKCGAGRGGLRKRLNLRPIYSSGPFYCRPVLFSIHALCCPPPCARIADRSAGVRHLFDRSAPNVTFRITL